MNANKQSRLNISNLRIEKAALLLLLKAEKRKIQSLDSHIPNLDKAIETLQEENDITIKKEDDFLYLKDDIMFDIFQDIPPESRKDVKKLILDFDPSFLTYEISEKTRKIVDLTKSKIDPEDIKDFRPEPPLPVVWEDFVDRPGAKDYLPQQVSPDNSIRQKSNGEIELTDKSSPGCLFPAIKDPFNTIKINSDLTFEIEHYDENDDVFWMEASIDKCEKITHKNFRNFAQPNRTFSGDKIKSMLEAFEKKTGRNGRRWDQEPYYLFVRNSLRFLGFDARYTGGPGMKTRSDVTTYDPIHLTIEVKSPAEGKINTKAVRQAYDSSIPFAAEIEGEIYRAAIGEKVSGDAIEYAEMYKKADDINIPLIKGKILLFLVLMQPQCKLEPLDYDFLFNLSGKVTKENLKEMYSKNFERNDKDMWSEFLAIIEKCF